jgi:hypothetical protein
MLSESNMKPTEFLERIQEVKDLDISFIYKEDVNFEEEKEEYPLLDTASSIQFMEKNQPHEKLVREQPRNAISRARKEERKDFLGRRFRS